MTVDFLSRPLDAARGADDVARRPSYVDPKKRYYASPDVPDRGDDAD